jgi:2-polyprenyl-6-methoxyphenol hydroxylase-like FAD-dependent oxidoreductase
VPATRVFRRAGILDDIRTDTITRFPSICWRNVRTGERLTGVDLSVVSSELDRMTVLPLNQLLQIMLRHCQEKYAEYVTVLFNHKVVDIGQDEGKVWAIVEAGADGEEKKTLTFQADYLIGCDGGQSTVRKCLFQRSWPGETFEHQLFVQNVRPFLTDNKTSIVASLL